MQKRNLRTGRLLWLGSAVILVGVPFHALVTAWFASRFGHFDLIRLWKEFILLALALGTIWLVIRHPALRRDLQRSRMVQLVLSFIGFMVVMTGVGLIANTVSWQAALYGLIIDTRAFVFLLVLLVAGHLAPLPVTRRRWILIPAVVVIGFGLLQLLVLPPDFLSHFGYGPHTLPAFQPVDNKPDLARVQASLRGPNPLGAYLVPVIMSFVAMALLSKRRRVTALLSIAGGLVVLYGTYSRSAALGLLVALGSFAYWTAVKPQAKKLFLGLSVLALIFAGGLLVGLRNNDTFQNLVFHTNEKSTATYSTNSVRFSALKNGLRDIAHTPLGSGVGSAGPASLRNRDGGVRIAENFFIQIGQEAGIFGLMLFVAVLGALGRILYRERSDTLVRATLASLLGLIVINLVSHAWADDTLIYTSFALLGYAVIRTSTSPLVASQLNGKRPQA